MTRHIHISTAAALMLLGLTGCNGILDVSPKDQLSDVDPVFADPGLAEGFLDDIYGGLADGLYEIMLGSLTDETQFIHGDGTDKIVQSHITARDGGAIGDGRFRNSNLWRN